VKSTVETLSPTRVRLAVEVSFDELAPSLAKAYKEVAKQVRVPGFRPGKAPAAIIDRQVGRGAVLEEAMQDAVPTAYSEAVQEHEVKVMGQPEIEVTKLEDNEVLEFTAEVDVRPELTLPPLADISVTVDAAEVTDDDIAEQLTALRDRFATLSGADRPVREGDFVSIDLAATVEGETLDDLTTTGSSYEVGADSLVPGLDTALAGVAAGESRTFSSELVAGEHAGKPAEVTVTVRSVKERELPELDDDFAQTASEFETIEELRGDIRDRIGRMKLAQQGAQARDKVLEALIEAGDVPLPESVVEQEVSWRRENLQQQLQGAGMALEDYLTMQDQTTETFDAEQRSSAEEAVRTQLVLDTIADAEQVPVSDADLTEHIVAEAQRFGMSPQELAQRVQEAGNIGALIAEVRRNKAMRVALGAATVTDESGNSVDLTALLGPAEDDFDADAAVDLANSDEAIEHEVEADADYNGGVEMAAADNGADEADSDDAEEPARS
jgi:trigger factor